MAFPSDAFTSDTLDTAQWSTSGVGTTSTTTPTQDVLNLTADTAAGSARRVISVGTGDLTGTSVYFQPVAFAANANNVVRLRANSNTYIEFYRNAGSSLLHMRVVNAGVAGSSANVTYDATTHAWLRFRESGGTTFWETYDSGAQTWTTRLQATNPFALTTLDLFIETYNGSGSTTPGTFQIDNVNINAPATGGVGTAPVISSVMTENVLATSATVTWATDELATSRVYYDTVSHADTNYALSSPDDTTADSTSHSVTITGLTGGTIYYYRVRSADVDGLVAWSDEYSFTTPESTTQPFNTLSDGFNDGVLDTTLWTTGGTAPVESGGVLSCTPANTSGASSRAISRNSYSLVDSSLAVDVAQISNTTSQVRLRSGGSSSTYLEFAKLSNSTNLRMRAVLSGAVQQEQSITYSATTHAWWRFREQNGITYFETHDNASGGWVVRNGSGWTNPFTLSSMDLWIEAYNDPANVQASPTAFQIDNVNANAPASATGKVPVFQHHYAQMGG